jgi:hypothetical protein
VLDDQAFALEMKDIDTVYCYTQDRTLHWLEIVKKVDKFDARINSLKPSI